MSDKQKIILDCCLIVLSIALTIILLKTGAIDVLVRTSLNFGSLGIFITGIFFTSIFTLTPAGAILAIFAQHQPLLHVALLGAAGGVVGDLIIYLFIKDSIAPKIFAIVKKIPNRRLQHFLHLGMWRWLTPFVGAIIIASPLPDEIGLAMLGMSKTSLLLFIPLSFVSNFLSVAAIALAVTHLPI